MPPIPCPLCELPKPQQYCAPCLREGVDNHAEVVRQAAAATRKAVQHAEYLLAGPITTGGTAAPVRGATAWRELRAAVAASEARCAALRADIAATRGEIKEARDAVLRSDAPARDEALAAARRARLHPEDLRAQIALVKQQQREVGKRIIQARRVLVREVVDVFGVQAVQRRGSEVWQIAGIDLPQPEEFRLYPSVLINGAYVHTIHLLALVAGYLSVALPFTPVYVSDSGALGPAHIGRPQMRANAPFLHTTKWRDKHVLWMSSTASIKKSAETRGVAAVAAVLERSGRKHTATLEAFALLAHAAAYLAYTQGVPGIGLRDTGGGRARDSDDDDELPPPDTSGVLVSPTSVLHLLALAAESPTLGCRAHEPGTSDTLNHMMFALDVKLLVRAVLRAEKARWGARAAPADDDGEELSEGWEVMDG